MSKHLKWECSAGDLIGIIRLSIDNDPVNKSYGIYTGVSVNDRIRVIFPDGIRMVLPWEVHVIFAAKDVQG